ncbi:MAG: 3-deoxy-D-manno-octulosonic acid transferase, partial [Planctomycetota bacterium]|nr:3-deoxy-D-manno-octulosonic acid transferase [Planctomycetota bacterium]
DQERNTRSAACSLRHEAAAMSYSKKPSFDDFLRPKLLDAAYGAMLLASAPILLPRIRSSERYRAGLEQRLGRVSPRIDGKRCLWVHAASVGEVQAARPLIGACQEEWPDLHIILSTQTKTGAETAAKVCSECQHLYFPLDMSCIVQRVLDALKPDCIALVEREIWPNFIEEAARREIPVIQVNARITEFSSKAYRWLYPVLGKTLQSISQFAAQSDEYRERFESLAIPAERIQVTGNLKYDSVETSVDEALVKRLRRETFIDEGQPILVAGSIHPGEEELLVEACRPLWRKLPNFKLVLVPRHLEKTSQIERRLMECQAPLFVRKTDLKDQASQSTSHGIVIADTVGELRGLYALATVVFIGGTFVPIGGHNLLEPAALAKPIVFGPQIYQQQADASYLLDAGAAVEVQEREALAKQVFHLFNSPALRTAMGNQAKLAVLEQQGSSDRTLKILRKYLFQT